MYIRIHTELVQFSEYYKNSHTICAILWVLLEFIQNRYCSAILWVLFAHFNFLSIICLFSIFPVLFANFQFSKYYLHIFNFASIICLFWISSVLFAYSIQFQISQYYLHIFLFSSIICLFSISPSIICLFSIFPVSYAYFQFSQYYLPIFNFPSIICLTELSSANLVSNSFEFLQHLKCAKFALSSFSWFSSTRST